MKRYEKSAEAVITLHLNGRERSARVEPRMLLSDCLRHALGATGTHVGCEHGVCGACTVMVEGVAVRSCLQLAVQADGLRVDTVEGLNRADPEALTDLQQSFHRNHALQCGFCTAGILMSCTDFLARVPAPTEAAVRDMLSGHLCRCTGYTNIVTAVLEVAAERQAAAKGETQDA
ncbi:MAG: [2Fe-2S] binding domain protein [Herminiimonas sp.]|nr:[2Fe-2S] binding domain protein [Herminiimonas sp.]